MKMNKHEVNRTSSGLVQTAVERSRTPDRQSRLGAARQHSGYVRLRAVEAFDASWVGLLGRHSFAW
jgi:hypothetical protein